MGRIAMTILGSLAALVVVVLVEVLLARRTPHIEGYTAAQLDGTYGDGSGEPVHMVWIGDSTGDGVGASSPERALPRLVVAGLSRRVRLTVLARSGSRAIDALNEQLPQLVALEPDWVIVGIGNNDVVHLTPRRRFERQLSRLLDGVAAAKPSRVAVLGVAEFAGTPLFAQPLRMLAGWRADQMDDIVRAVARRHTAVYVDIKGKAGPAFVGDPAHFHARDRFHPSDAGYAAWARVTVEAITRAGW